jgi:hypothetical protein
MRRLNISAYLFTALLAVGCSDKKGPDGVDDPDEPAVDSGKRDAGKDAGKKDGGLGVDPNGGTGGKGDSGPTGGGIKLDPMSPPFNKDATTDSGLTPKEITDLKAGGKTCSAKILYPAEGTVFPAGLTPPTVMWAGATTGSYIKLSYDKLDSLAYEAAFGPSDPGELVIAQEDWNEIVRRTRGSDLLVTVSAKVGGSISTCTTKWKIAQGAMTGSVFYNTYNHPQKLGNGAVVRLKLGQPKSEIYLSYEGLPSIAGPCISCHSVSTNGAKLAASLHNYTPIMQSYKASSYTVGADKPTELADLPESTFGAFTPDGELMLSMGNPDCTDQSNAFPRSPNNFPLIPGPSLATLHDTNTGMPVQAKGLKPEWFMWMAQFSPKGDKVAFNHAKMGADGKTDRRELAVMDYDQATRTFSNLKVLVSNEGPTPSIDYAPAPTLSPGAAAGNNCTTPTPSDVGAIPKGSCTGPCYPAWPFFTPDGEGVVYSMISEPDFMVAMPGRDAPALSELWYIDVQSKQKLRLDVANDSGGDEWNQRNYYPTMLPVQVGGYYWVFWTSTRPWGHRDLSTSLVQAGSNWFGGGAVIEAARKRIWVSAIKPRAVTEAGLEDLADTSSPAFYLEGQEASGNVRVFATLNPCKDNGGECSSGLDCCTGFCNIEKGAEKGSCVPPKTCSDLNEKCKVDTDCCPAPEGEQERLCIGDYCGFQIQ